MENESIKVASKIRKFVMKSTKNLWFLFNQAIPLFRILTLKNPAERIVHFFFVCQMIIAAKSLLYEWIIQKIFQARGPPKTFSSKKWYFFSQNCIFAQIALKFCMRKLQMILLLLDTKNFVWLHRSSEIWPLEVGGYGAKKWSHKGQRGLFSRFFNVFGPLEGSHSRQIP